jgi:hypothetical protein
MLGFVLPYNWVVKNPGIFLSFGLYEFSRKFAMICLMNE